MSDEKTTETKTTKYEKTDILGDKKMTTKTEEKSTGKKTERGGG